ncbi:MAG: hypothetical protein KAR20_14975, partial [Candidatus Heimdallarchaeota archaeon]|nr:hypothetical protein [Candidatus Heimdallarchaeota archaeon]
LPQWFGDLRIIHKDEYWPTYLQYELTEWAQETKISSTEKNLPENKFHNSVVYLPFFMARVTIGQASLEDLEIPLANMKFYIQRLIDFDREWFVYSHSLLVYFLLQFSNKEG